MADAKQGAAATCFLSSIRAQSLEALLPNQHANGMDAPCLPTLPLGDALLRRRPPSETRTTAVCMCTQQLWCVTCIYAWLSCCCCWSRSRRAQCSSLCTIGATYRPCPTTQQMSMTSNSPGVERRTMHFSFTATHHHLVMHSGAAACVSHKRPPTVKHVAQHAVPGVGIASHHTTPITPTPAGHRCTPHPPLSHKACLRKCGDAAFGPWCMRCCCAIHA